MEPSGLSLFQHLHGKMRWLTERQTVISQNIANVDTPGYTARELKPLSFASRIAMAEAGGGADGPRPASGGSAGHFKIASSSAGFRPSEAYSSDQQVSISKNNVDLEHELKKSADTALDYQTLSHLYRKHLDLLRMAVKGEGA